MRIGSSFPEPRNRRMMSTWLSYRDLTDADRDVAVHARA